VEAEAMKSGTDSGGHVIFGRHCRPKLGSNFMDADMAGAVEGSSHDLSADTMRRAGGTAASAIRGFRYGTHVPAGWPITMMDVYHYIPAGSFLLSRIQCGKSNNTSRPPYFFIAETWWEWLFRP